MPGHVKTARNSRALQTNTEKCKEHHKRDHDNFNKTAHAAAVSAYLTLHSVA